MHIPFTGASFFASHAYILDMDKDGIDDVEMETDKQGEGRG
jgi:hypothetical protein